MFSHATTVVFCAACSTILCQPTGGMCFADRVICSTIVEVNFLALFSRLAVSVAGVGGHCSFLCVLCVCFSQLSSYVFSRNYYVGGHFSFLCVLCVCLSHLISYVFFTQLLCLCSHVQCNCCRIFTFPCRAPFFVDSGKAKLTEGCSFRKKAE